jgi:SAM-dependent methyltransferase
VTEDEGTLEAPAVGHHYIGDLGQQYYGWQRESGHAGAALIAPFFAPYVRASDRLIDFGCGGGFLLELLAAREKAGIEPNAAARKDAMARGLRVVGSPADLPDRSADVVISNHVLEHAVRPLDELIALRRLLRPGGCLVLMVPVDDWRSERRPDHNDTNHHLYTWTPLLLGNLLDEAGYTDIKADIVTHAWPPFAPQLHRVVGMGAFDALARVWSVVRRRRQVQAVSHRPR